MAQGFDMEWVTYGRTSSGLILDTAINELGVLDIATEYNPVNTVGNTYVVGSFIEYLRWNNPFQELELDVPITPGCGNRQGNCPVSAAQGFLSSFSLTGFNDLSLKFNSTDGRHTIVKSVAVDRSNGFIYVAGDFFNQLRITDPGTANNTGSTHNYQILTTLNPNIYPDGASFVAKFDLFFNLVDIIYLYSSGNEHVKVEELRYESIGQNIYIVGSFAERLNVDDVNGNSIGTLPIAAISPPGDVNGFVLRLRAANLVPERGNVIHSKVTDELTALDVIPHFGATSSPYSGPFVAVGGHFGSGLAVQEPWDITANLGLTSGAATPNVYSTSYTSANNDLLVAMLDNDLNYVWLNKIEGDVNTKNHINRIACDASSSSLGGRTRIAVTGSIRTPKADIWGNRNIQYSTSPNLQFNATPPIFNGTTLTTINNGCQDNTFEAFVFVYDGNGNLITGLQDFHNTCNLGSNHVYGSQGLATDLVNSSGTPSGTVDELLVNGGIYDGRVSSPTGFFFDSDDPTGFLSRYNLDSNTFMQSRSFPENLPLSPIPSTSPFALSSITFGRSLGNSFDATNGTLKVNDYLRIGGYVSPVDFELQRSLTTTNTVGVDVIYENTGPVPPYAVLTNGFAYYVGVFGSTGGLGNAESFKNGGNELVSSSEQFNWINANTLAELTSNREPFESLRIIDALGRVIRTYSNLSNLAINKLELPSGIFTLQIRQLGKNSVRKLEVVH
jgi:hypothetical protein